MPLRSSVAFWSRAGPNGPDLLPLELDLPLTSYVALSSYLAFLASVISTVKWGL